MTEITFYPNGNIHTIISTKNHIRHGIAKTFYPDNTIQCTMNFNEGEIHGEIKEFYLNGSLSAHSNITNDNSAFYKAWYSNGSYKLNCSFIDERTEKSITYFEILQNCVENGNIKTISHFVNKLREGLCEEYYESGTIKNRYYFSEDVKNGICEEFYENGQIKTRCPWKNGSLNLLEVENWTSEGKKYVPKLIVIV